MRHNITAAMAAMSAMIMLGGCEKENFFQYAEGEGQLDTGTLSVDYINSNRQVRASGVSVDDFSVNFIKTDGNQQELVKTYKYGQMPQVVSLPKGNYKAEASFGDNKPAAWEEPYYLGNSTFTIEEGKVTDDVDPVECELSNIRIAVNIDDLGLGLIGNDAKVEVKAGQAGLTYDRSTNDKSGYFRYVDGSHTITATFSGTIDGEFVTAESRSYNNAAPGNFYKINFTITKPDNMEPGDITLDDGNLNIDATITIIDENHVVDPNEGEEPVITDEMERPTEGQPDDPNGGGNTPDDPNVNPDDPNTPDNPDDPNGGDNPGQTGGPRIILLSDGLVLNQSCVVSECAFDVDSDTGIDTFNIHIESPNLTADELSTIGLAGDIDLVNPGEMAEALEGLGFPVNVGGMTHCHFDITDFLPMLAIFGPNEHKFHLTISDSTGTTTGYIGIKIE